MKNYKVVVIDDEEVSAEGISALVQSSMFPLSVEAIFYSSVEALKYLSDHPADIVITDINMPELSGLELIEKIKEIHPNMRFIVFTGYGSLEYAKQAMGFGIKHFILKPCSLEELRKSLSECIADLNRAYEDDILRKKELIKRRILDENLSEEKLANISFDLIMYPEKFYKELHSHLTYMFTDIIYGFSNINGAIVYYILEGSVVDKLKELANNKADLRTVIFYIADQNLYTAKDGFLLGKRCFDVSFYLLETKLIINVVDKVRSIKFERQFAEELKEIWAFIDMNKFTESKERFIQLKEMAEARGMLSELYVRKTEDFFIMVMQKYHIDSNEILAVGVKTPILATDFEEIFAYFNVLIQMVLEKSDEIVKQKQISAKLNWVIENHYSNKELSLRWISKNILYLNPEYLGKIYLKETSQKFTSRLLEFRMKKSKELLQKRYRITDVADLVGYENPDYFGQQFKKKYACTPREYLNKLKTK